MEPIKYTHTDRMHNTQAAYSILPYIFSYIKPISVIDIGCGNGSWLKVASKLGADIIQGVDGIKVADDQLNIPEGNFLKHDLTKPLQLNKKFDLVLSLEVAEHLPEAAANIFIDTLTNHGNCILFSAAIPNQGGQFHFNEQWPEYWHLKFKERGYLAYDIIRNKFWNDDNVFWWYKQSIIIYAKEGVLKDSNLLPVSIVNAMVHPQLYRKKIFHPKYIRNNRKLIKLAFECIKFVFKKR